MWSRSTRRSPRRSRAPAVVDGPSLVETKTYRFDNHAVGLRGRRHAYRDYEPRVARVAQARPGRRCSGPGCSPRASSPTARSTRIEDEVAAEIEAARGSSPSRSPYPGLDEAFEHVYTNPIPIRQRRRGQAPDAARSATCRRSTKRCTEEMRRDERVFIMGEDVGLEHAGRHRRVPSTSSAPSASATPRSPRPASSAPRRARRWSGMRPIVDLMHRAVHVRARWTSSSASSPSPPTCTAARPACRWSIRASMFYGGANAAQHSDRPCDPVHDHARPEDHRAVDARTTSRACSRAAIREDDPVHLLRGRHAVGHAGRGPGRASTWSRSAQADVKRAGHRRHGRRDRRLRAARAGRRGPLAERRRVGRGGRPAHARADGLRPRSCASVEKTGRLVVADPSHRTCSAASEIAATGGRGRLLAAAGAHRAGHHAGHAHPVQPAARAQIYPTADRIAEAVRQTLE